MKVEKNDFNNGLIDDTIAFVKRDENGFTWVYKGKEHGYDSWSGIPPEDL